MKFHPKVFSEDDRRNIYDFLNTPGWETGWKSHSRTDGFTFLHKHFAGFRKTRDDEVYPCEDELKESAPLVYEAWQHVKDTIFKDHTLVRCYANGMAYGMDGTVHTDSKRPDSYTAVYYPHDRWSPNWGGETLFYNKEESSVVACCYPHPNSAVVFSGNIPHRASGVSRMFPGLRITLMFKTEYRNGREAPDVPA